MEYQKIEECIEKKNELFKVDEKEVMAYANRVEEANKEAIFVSFFGFLILDFDESLLIDASLLNRK